MGVTLGAQANLDCVTVWVDGVPGPAVLNGSGSVTTVGLFGLVLGHAHPWAYPAAVFAVHEIRVYDRMRATMQDVLSSWAT